MAGPPPALWQEPFAKLKEQLDEYEKFVRAEVLPIARTDFRLPPEDYAFSPGLFSSASGAETEAAR
jgi:hypothetical protein